MVKFFSHLFLISVAYFFCFQISPSYANNDQTQDIPEEILRTEIIIEGRSPIDNQPLSASEYAEMQSKNQQSPYPTEINSDLQQKILLLRLLKMIRTVTPF